MSLKENKTPFTDKNPWTQVPSDRPLNLHFLLRTHLLLFLPLPRYSHILHMPHSRLHLFRDPDWRECIFRVYEYAVDLLEMTAFGFGEEYVYDFVMSVDWFRVEEGKRG